MSKNDMLGSLVRALVGLSPLRHGLVRDILNRLRKGDFQFVFDLKQFLRNWEKREELVRLTLPSDYSHPLVLLNSFKKSGWEVEKEAEIILETAETLRHRSDGVVTLVWAERIGKRPTYEDAIRFARARGYRFPPRIIGAHFYKKYMETAELKRAGIKSWIVMHDPVEIPRLGHWKRLGVLHHPGENPTLYAFQDRDGDRFRYVGGDVLVFLAPDEDRYRATQQAG